MSLRAMRLEASMQQEYENLASSASKSSIALKIAACVAVSLASPKDLRIKGPDSNRMVDVRGFEPLTPWLQTRCSPS
jgi:hypothetical protein